MNKKIDDIVNILYSSTTFTDQSNEDVRDQVSRKFGLLNQKLLTDLSTLKTECTQHAESQKHQAIAECKLQIKRAREEVKAELLGHIEDNKKLILRIMRTETKQTIMTEIRQGLEVPDVIGRGCPYSSFSKFMSMFYGKTEADLIKMERQLAELQKKQSEFYAKQEKIEQEQQDFEEALKEQTKPVDTADISK